MTVRQFHLLFAALLVASAGLMLLIDAAAQPHVPYRFQPRQPAPGTGLSLATPAVSSPELWLEPSATPSAGDKPDLLLDHWRDFPVQAAAYVSAAHRLQNHLRLGPPGQVQARLSTADRGKLWRLFCLLTRQPAQELQQLGFDALVEQSDRADSLIWLATTRPALKAYAGDRLPADWDAREGSPRGTLVWWLALQFPDQAPPPAGAFVAAGRLGAGPPLYTAPIGNLTLYATTEGPLLLIGPSLAVLEEALRAAHTPAAAGGTPSSPGGYRRFLQHLADPAGRQGATDFHAFADGALVAEALESAQLPETWIELAQVRQFEQLEFDGTLRRNGLELTARVVVPQRSIYDFIALDGDRHLDRFLPADSFGVADLRVNLAGMIRYALLLASKGYFGAKAQQAALLAGPLLTMSNLADAFGNEVAISLAPSQDRTYLAWSLAMPWRQPHTLAEISSLTRLAGAPFDGPLNYRDETLWMPRFKAKMEFRYPVLIELPDAYVYPPPPPPAIAPPADKVLMIAANGWNLDDVLNVKQGRVPTLAQAQPFQERMQAHAGGAAVQVYANLSQGFGYAYVTLLGELYGLPVNGVPIEEDLLPRSEAFGNLGHVWISLGREKLSPPTDDPGVKLSRLRFRLVWNLN